MLSCLVNSGVKGKKALLKLLKNKKIKPKLRSVICMYLREFGSKNGIPTLEIKLVDDLPGLEYSGSYRNIWGYHGEIFAKLPDDQPSGSSLQEPVLLFNQQELEALVRRYLVSDFQDSKRVDRSGRSGLKLSSGALLTGNEKFLSCYWALYRGSGLQEKHGFPKVVINVLISHTGHEENQVREAALNSLGNIGLPYVEPAKSVILQ